MNCLCCGRPLPADREEIGWHKACIKRFFGTNEIPELDLSNAAIEHLAMESTSKGYTVAGVQKKLSLHLISEGTPRLTLVNYPTGYILKPQSDEFRELPESEQLVMSMADICGIKTVPHALIKVEDKFAYITKRIDRIISDDGQVRMPAMEDFCQLDLRLTQDKYRGSYERCAKIIRQYSSRPGLDVTELFLRLVFSFMTGNSDMHLKNFSLIETSENSNQYILSPAYDLLPVNVIMPEDTEEFALPMNGKKRNLREKDFIVFGESCGINRKTAEKMIQKVISLQPAFADMIKASYLLDSRRTNFSALITERAAIFHLDKFSSH